MSDQTPNVIINLSSAGLQTQLLKLFYAHCGGDPDTSTMQYPAILRGDPTAATDTQTPRFIVYHDGIIYDNAPADYSGGEYI